MSEVTFAKAFLVTLDKKPIKLPADHVSDPRKYPNQSPYILPKQSHPFPKKDPAQYQSKSITVTIKPMKGGEAVSLSVMLEDTVHDIKSQYAQRVGLTPDKVKLLLNKKPAADLKTLQDLGVGSDVDMSAMLMGGATADTPIASPAVGTPTDGMEIDTKAPHPGSERAQMQAEEAGTKQDTLKTAEFWSDLEGFLAQRLRDQGEAARLAKLFKSAALS